MWSGMVGALTEQPPHARGAVGELLAVAGFVGATPACAGSRRVGPLALLRRGATPACAGSRLDELRLHLGRSAGLTTLTDPDIQGVKYA